MARRYVRHCEATGSTLPEADFVISADGERFMDVASPDPATVVFRCDAETFIVIAYGRIEPAAAVAGGRLAYAGDQDWAEVFLQSFVGG